MISAVSPTVGKFLFLFLIGKIPVTHLSSSHISPSSVLIFLSISCYVYIHCFVDTVTEPVAGGSTSSDDDSSDESLPTTDMVRTGVHPTPTVFTVSKYSMLLSHFNSLSLN